MKTLALRGARCAFFLAQCIHAFAQGSLTPPGAPAPTMKTLDQVEPRKPINATNTPGDATNASESPRRAPTTERPGSWRLRKDGFSIEASDVTIDRRGFTLGGVRFARRAHMVAGTKRLTVRNGTISGWDADGVDEADAGEADGIYETFTRREQRRWDFGSARMVITA